MRGRETLLGRAAPNETGYLLEEAPGLVLEGV